jgi:hypothetical protein
MTIESIEEVEVGFHYSQKANRVMVLLLKKGEPIQSIGCGPNHETARAAALQNLRFVKVRVEGLEAS